MASGSGNGSGTHSGINSGIVSAVVVVVGSRCWWLVVGGSAVLSIVVVVLITFRNVFDDIDEFSVGTLVKFRVATHAHHHLFVH